MKFRIFKYAMGLSVLVLMSLFPKNSTSNTLPASTGQECAATLSNLQAKSNNLSAAIESMNSLLNSKDLVEAPLTVLFQVDLKNEEAVSSRILELEKADQKDEVLNLPEFENYAKCFSNGEFSNLLDETANKQASLNGKRLKFLKLTKAKRDPLIAAYEATRQQSTDNRRIEKQLSESKESLGRAQTSLIKSEENISSEKNSIEENITSSKALVEKYLVDIETEHIGFIGAIKLERQNLEDLSVQISSYLALGNSPNGLSRQYTAVDTIWRSAAKSLLNTFTKIDISSKFALPDLPADFAADDATSREYLALYKNAKKRQVVLAEQKYKLLLDLKALNFRLVSDTGKLRARLINECTSLGDCKEIGGFNEKSITGIITELRILPVKFLAGGFNKIVEFKAKINGGFDGWTDVSRQLLILFILILLPFLVSKVFNWISDRLNQVRKKILSRSIIDYRRRTQAGLWISRLNPFVPSVGMIASLQIARELIESTDLQELSFLILYLEVYYIYRATRLLLQILIEFLFSTESLALSSDLSARAELSARRLSKFFFLRYIFLHVVEDTVRRALAFGVASEVLFWLGLLVLVNEIRLWQNEILQAFENRFQKTWVRVKVLTNSRFKFILLPVLLTLVIGYEAFRLISLRLIKFDFFKRLVSEVFRKKLEQDTGLSKHLLKPDSNYLAVFDYYLPAKNDFYIDREPLMAKKILSTINSWLKGSSVDDLVVLVGNRGIGKTTSAKMIFEKVETDHKYFQWIKPKICHSSQLFEWLTELMGTQISSIDDFVKAEAALEKKTVIVVDDIHNLFIGRIGGFEAYQVFMEIISLRTTKIFWCLTANSHAWTYLQGVFGKEHFYGQVHEMRMWTDVEIQNLILARHKVTGYSRSFDKSISAYVAGNVLGEQAETQFFRLLWGQSRGNPRSALMYWISAVSQTSDSEIHVGVPRFINSGVVGTMSNEALMILAAIAKHDSLTLEELADVTRVNKLVIRKVIKESAEKELVWTDEHSRIRISSRSQNAIDYYLVGKNFLYE